MPSSARQRRTTASTQTSMPTGARATGPATRSQSATADAAPAAARGSARGGGGTAVQADASGAAEVAAVLQQFQLDMRSVLDAAVLKLGTAVERQGIAVTAAMAAAADAKDAADAALAAASAAAKAADAAAASVVDAHKRLDSLAHSPLSGQHTAIAAGRPAEMSKQVVVKLPPSADQASLMATARAAVAAAAGIEACGVTAALVLALGKQGDDSNRGVMAASATRQAAVRVWLQEPEMARSAVRHSSRLKGVEAFKGVYVQEALTAEQRRLKAAYWGLPELRAARASKRQIDWRSGVPYTRVEVEGGRPEWRPLPPPPPKEQPAP